jgi:hypothetical protein
VRVKDREMQGNNGLSQVTAICHQGIADSGAQGNIRQGNDHGRRLLSINCQQAKEGHQHKQGDFFPD